MEYKNQKGIISLTSWRERINDTAGAVLWNLALMCPEYHIVLVLSEDEFPNKEKDLPKYILQLEEMRIEILWVKKNYKTLKKVLFTMQKYPDVPIISADDDRIYFCDYAELLYQKAVETNNPIISHDVSNYRNGNYTAGWGTLYMPHCFNDINKIINEINKPENEIYYNDDDAFMEVLRCQNGIKPVFIEQAETPISICLDANIKQCDTYSKPDIHGMIRMKQGLDTNGLIFTYLGL